MEAMGKVSKAFMMASEAVEQGDELKIILKVPDPNGLLNWKRQTINCILCIRVLKSISPG